MINLMCFTCAPHCLLLLLWLFNSSVWLPLPCSSLWLDLCFWFLSLPFSIVELAEARLHLDSDCVCSRNVTPQIPLSLHLNLNYWVCWLPDLAWQWNLRPRFIFKFELTWHSWKQSCQQLRHAWLLPADMFWSWQIHNVHILRASLSLGYGLSEKLMC